MSNVINLKQYILDFEYMRRIETKIKESTRNTAVQQSLINKHWNHTDAILEQFHQYETKKSRKAG